jgi:hypothetical protein
MSVYKTWWWVFLFCFVTSCVYFPSMKRKRLAFAGASLQLEEMEKQRQHLASAKELLSLRLASQSDPAWIEMILMRDLGVVPEGYLKVYFQ